MFSPTHMPQLDTSMSGDALKTRPMLAAILLRDMTLPAPWGGEFSGRAGVHAYMVQAMDNGDGNVDAYFNVIPQMFDDYHVVGHHLANELTPEQLATISDDLPERLEHIREVLGDVNVWIMVRTRANQKMLGRAKERGTFETSEGPVEFDEGAYFNEDSHGRIWPVDAATFERDYEIVP